MNLDQYLGGAAHPANVPTPVAVRVGSRIEIRSLNSILYGAPPPEPKRRLRRRMAELIRQLATSTQSVTRDGLLAGGFSRREIDDHFRHALRLSGVIALGEML